MKYLDNAMLCQIVKQLREGHGNVCGSSTELGMCVVETKDYPNSRISMLRTPLKGKPSSLCVKLLHEDREDGRASRSDRTYKESQIRTEYWYLAELSQAFAKHPDLGVFMPVACFPEYLALVTVEEKGVKLSALMSNAKWYASSRERRYLTDLIYLVGKWLRVFQQCIRVPTETGYDSKEVYAYCDARIERLARKRPRQFSPWYCDRLRKLVDELCTEQRKRQLDISARHNDFGPNNMIVQGARLVVFDFSGSSWGPTCCDYIKFVSGLGLMKGSPLVATHTIEALEEAFIAGYGRRLDASDPVFLLYRVSYVLDKLDDVWLEWERMSWSGKVSSLALERKLYRWLSGMLGGKRG